MVDTAPIFIFYFFSSNLIILINQFISGIFLLFIYFFKRRPAEGLSGTAGEGDGLLVSRPHRGLRRGLSWFSGLLSG